MMCYLNRQKQSCGTLYISTSATGHANSHLYLDVKLLKYIYWEIVDCESKNAVAKYILFCKAYMVNQMKTI